MQRPTTDPDRPESNAEDATPADQGRRKNGKGAGDTGSPVEALARGLVAIGEKFRTRPTLRVL
jgi:hypothetical protein